MVTSSPSPTTRGLRFNERSHRYALDGRPVPGVTTIIGRGLPKPALPYWAAKLVAEAAADEAETMADTIRIMGRETVVKRLKRAPWRVRDDAAVRGTRVHALAEALVAGGGAVEVPAHLAGYVEGYARLLDELDLEPACTEARLANRGHWYAGTADLIAVIDGVTWLLDLKTSNSIHGSYALQCAAYAHAEVIAADDGTETPMPHIQRIGAIHLTTDGARLHEFPSLDEAWEGFLAVKSVADRITTIDSWGDKK